MANRPGPGSDEDLDGLSTLPPPADRESRELGILGKALRPTLRDGEVPSTRIDCPHAVLCSGCTLIDLDYVEQLAVKRAEVVASMARFSTLEYVYTSAVEPADPIVGYRTRARLLVSPPNLIGLAPGVPRERDTSGRSGTRILRRAEPQHLPVIDIPDCRILTRTLSDFVAELRALMLAPPPDALPLLLPYDAAGGGSLRALELREVQSSGASGSATTGVMGTWVMERQRCPALEELRNAAEALLSRLPRAISLAVKLHDVDTPSNGDHHLAGIEIVENLVGSTPHFTTHGTYALDHRDQAARIHAICVREVASLDIEPHREGDEAAGPPAERTRVLDLYGGTGALSLALAKAHNDVLMVEASEAGVRLARAAATAQRLSNLAARAGHAEDVLGELIRAKEVFDAVVINPPKRGVSPVAREAITKLVPALIVYVSSEPSTLARDLDHFARLGYITSDILPLDPSPLCGDVETVAVLHRGPPARPLIIFENEEIVVADKEAHEPADLHPDYVSCLRERAETATGGKRLHLLHRVDADTSGVAMFARTETLAQKWSAALRATGRPVYIVGVKGTAPGKGAINRELRDRGQSFPARTRYRRLAVAGGHSIVRVLPDGGLTHQIRRHFAAIGHPVLGDERYGHESTNRFFEDRLGLDRNFVHLVRIEVDHPDAKQKLLFESPVRGDLRATLERLGGADVLEQLEQKRALGARRAVAPTAAGGPLPPPGFAASDEPQSSAFPSSTSADLRPRSAPPPPDDAAGDAAPGGQADEAPRTLRQRIDSADD